MKQRIRNLEDWTASFESQTFTLENGCWHFSGSRNSKGYGRFYALGRCWMAHRFSYWLWTGKTIPVGFTIDHLCFNRACVNPSHMEVVLWIVNLRRGSHKYNSKKTHCKRGHPYSEPNVYKWGTRRVCIACRIITKRAFRERRAARIQST